MPPKKLAKGVGEKPKRKPAKKKPAVEKAIPVPPTKPEPRRSREHHGNSGGALLFFIVIILIAVFGVYAFQKQQTDSVVSKLSSLEGKLENKLQALEDGFEDELEEAEKEKEEAVMDATMNTYESVFFGHTFRYPKTLPALGVDTSIDEFLREDARFGFLSTDGESATIDVRVLQNIENLSLSEWDIGLDSGDDAFLSVEGEPSTLAVTVAEREAVAYSWEDVAGLLVIVVPFDEYHMLELHLSADPETHPEIVDAFETMLTSFTF